MLTAHHLVDLPVVFEGMSPAHMSICNTFNKAVREFAAHNPLDPSIISNALNSTFIELDGQFNKHQIMQTLASSGLRAPRSYLPPELQHYGYGSREILSRVSQSFDSAMRGFVGWMTPATPKYNPDLNTCRPGR